MKRVSCTHLHSDDEEFMPGTHTLNDCANLSRRKTKTYIFFFSFPDDSIDWMWRHPRTWNLNELTNHRIIANVYTIYRLYGKAVQNYWRFLYHYFDCERMKNLVCSIAHLLVKLLATVLKTMACRKRPRTHANPTHTHTHTHILAGHKHTQLYKQKKRKQNFCIGMFEQTPFLALLLLVLLPMVVVVPLFSQDEIVGGWK